MAISSYGVRAETAPDGSEASATGLARLLIDRGEAERLAAVLKAIADPTRLQLLRLIERAPRGKRASVTSRTAWVCGSPPSVITSRS